MTEEETIRTLWRTPSFSGAFTGIATFQSALEAEKNIKVSRSKLIKIMSKDNDFLLEMHKLKRFPRRKMIVHGFCKYLDWFAYNNWQACFWHRTFFVQFLTKKASFILIGCHYSKQLFNRLWQADLGQLFPFNGYNYFLVCTDIFSRRIFSRALR